MQEPKAAPSEPRRSPGEPPRPSAWRAGVLEARPAGGEVAIEVEAGRDWASEQTRTTSDLADTAENPAAGDEGLGMGEAALTFKDVAFSTRVADSGGKARKPILEPASGHFESGSMVAIMGPSGSGKTTLLDILAAKKTAPYEGSVHFNGSPRDRLFWRMCAYVPQHDVMPAYLTVKEIVLFQSALKQEWPRGFTGDMASTLMDNRLKTLGLYDVRDSRIGDEHIRGISGGQKRRLSLARGIASGARLLFCDEPTSGLSATDAESCVQYMRLICDRFRATVVVVIHQPRVEVAELFDHLVLLTSSPGRVVYNGSISGAEAHFEKAVGRPMPARMNPMDYCMDLVTPEHKGSCPDRCVKFYNAVCSPDVLRLVESELNHLRSTPMEVLQLWRRTMEQYGPLPPVRNSRYGVRFRRQLQLVFLRQLTLNLRDAQGLAADLVLSVVKAVVIGLAYVNIGSLDAPQQMGFFFMVLMSCAIEPLKNMPKIIADRLIMKMEVSDALYSDWAYLISFSVISSAQTLLSNGLYVGVLFCMSGLEWSLFGDILLWTSLLSFTMDSLFLMIAAVARDTSAAFIMSLPFLMLFLLYNGFTTTKRTVPSWMTWAVETSPVAHAMEAVIIAAARVYDHEGSMYPTILSQFGYVDNRALALQVMFGCVLFFRVLQAICLRRLNNIQR